MMQGNLGEVVGGSFGTPCSFRKSGEAQKRMEKGHRPLGDEGGIPPSMRVIRHGQVESLLDQIDEAVVEADLQHDIGIIRARNR